MAKKKRRNKDTANWLQQVTKKPLDALDYEYKQMSRQTPIQPRRRRDKRSYGDRGLGVFLVALGCVFFVVFGIIAIRTAISQIFSISDLVKVGLILGIPGVLFLLWGIDHLRHS
jgi:hypothetical protein